MATNNQTFFTGYPYNVDHVVTNEARQDKRGTLPVLVCHQSKNEKAFWQCTLPNGAATGGGYTATTGLKVIIKWSAVNGATTGNVYWATSFELIGATDNPSPYSDANFPAEGSANEVNTTTAVNATAGGLATTTLSVTIAKIQNGQTTAPAAGDMLRFKVRRDGTQGTDTLADDVYIHQVQIQDY